MTIHKTAAFVASFMLTASLCVAAGYYRELLALPKEPPVNFWYSPYVSTALAVMPLQEESGTNVSDLSNYQVSGIVSGAVAGGTNGMLFDGVNDSIALSTNFSISGRTKLTVAFWFDCDRIQVNDGMFGTYFGVFGQQSVDVPAGGGLFFVGISNDYISGTSAGAYYTNGWRSAVFVYDGTQPAVARGKIYIEQTNIASSGVGAIPAIIPTSSAYRPFHIGHINGLDRWWKGRIIRFVVDDDAWSASDVSAWHNNTRPATGN